MPSRKANLQPYPLPTPSRTLLHSPAQPMRRPHAPASNAALSTYFAFAELTPPPGARKPSPASPPSSPWPTSSSSTPPSSRRPACPSCRRHHRHLPLRRLRLHPHGRARQLPARPRSRHGPQRLLHLHRRPRHARPWQTALGAVFLSGIIFLLLTFTGLRQRLLAAIPHSLHSAVAAGIGLFIAFIGLRDSGIIVASPATAVTLGNLRNPPPPSLSSASSSSPSSVPSASAPPCSSAFLAPSPWSASPSIRSTGRPTTLHLGPTSAPPPSTSISPAPSTSALFEIIFVFLFVDLFDNIGTLVAVTDRAGLILRTGPQAGIIPRLNRIFFADAAATIVGSLAGTSTVTSYIESASGVAAGGRTGVTAIVTGLLFLVSLFVAPLVGAIPTFATAPALILVGALMISGVASIEWDDPSDRHPRLPHHPHHSPHLLHRNRPQLRPHRLRLRWSSSPAAPAATTGCSTPSLPCSSSASPSLLHGILPAPLH